MAKLMTDTEWGLLPSLLRPLSEDVTPEDKEFWDEVQRRKEAANQEPFDG